LTETNHQAPWSYWPSPAKINLFLQITGQRADGYHLLQTVFQLLDWGDQIALSLREDQQILRVDSDAYGVNADDDLVVRAAKLLQVQSSSAKGVNIRVNKRIPLGGGFGGGSSNAATVLLVLNQLWKTGFSIDELAQLGLQLGADVPVFVRGFTAWGEGIGDQLQPLKLPKAAFLLVDSGVHVPTQELFRAPELTRNATPATIASFVSGTQLGNAFEPVLRARQPIVDSLLRRLSQLGPACLTGTGGGCFVRFNTLQAAQEALKQVPEGFKAWVAQGVDISPLHAALEL
jgi:4-diphosphocytidyl-2-C-methyl-D-erythritol kinase